MTTEEMERAIAFILEQQAQFASNQQQSAQQITHLSAAMLELAEAHTRTEETLSATGERLNALINTVERHISEGHGGTA